VSAHSRALVRFEASAFVRNVGSEAKILTGQLMVSSSVVVVEKRKGISIYSARYHPANVLVLL